MGKECIKRFVICNNDNYARIKNGILDWTFIHYATIFEKFSIATKQLKKIKGSGYEVIPISFGYSSNTPTKEEVILDLKSRTIREPVSIKGVE